MWTASNVRQAGSGYFANDVNDSFLSSDDRNESFTSLGGGRAAPEPAHVYQVGSGSSPRSA